VVVELASGCDFAHSVSPLHDLRCFRFAYSVSVQSSP
jgi:hypothetical protein